MCLRNPYFTLAMLILPIIFVLVGLLASKGSSHSGVPVVLSLNQYPSKDIQSSVYFAGMKIEYFPLNELNLYDNSSIIHLLIQLFQVITCNRVRVMP